jgi:hypothetical protein
MSHRPLTNTSSLKIAAAYCPSSMKCLFKDIRSALTPSRPLLYTCVYYKKPVLEIRKQIQVCSTNRRDFPTSPFAVRADSWQRSWQWYKMSFSLLIHHVFLWIQPLLAECTPHHSRRRVYVTLWKLGPISLTSSPTTSIWLILFLNR